MFSSTMRNAVLQALVIHVCSMILDHHLGRNTFDKMMENEAFMNLWNATEKANTPGVTRNAIKTTRGRQSLDAGHTLNETLSFNHTTATNGTFGTFMESPESFYRQKLPRQIFIHLFLFALQYWWFIGLEKILPARPRSKEVPPQRDNKAEMSEDREEEVVQKWIAQGKVQRASLNWCNTFLKWVLVMTLGEVVLHTLGHVIRGAINLSSPKVILAELKSHLVYNLFSTYFSPEPLAVLIAFVVVPAHKRLVFIMGADLIWGLFYHTVVRAFAVWALKTEFLQQLMRNITASTEKMQAGGPEMPGRFRYDEL